MTFGDVIAWLIGAFFAAVYLHALVLGHEERHPIRYAIYFTLLGGLITAPFWGNAP